MITKGQILSDIELALHQGAPSNDSELSWPQLEFWVSYHLNQVVATECNSKISRGEMIPPVYVKSQDLTLPDVTTLSDDSNRISLDLDEEVLALNADSGVVRVVTESGDVAYKASVASLNMFNNMRFAKPSQYHLIYYRVGSTFYFEGFSVQDAPFESITVWYVPKQDISTLENDDEVLVSDLALPQVIDMVVQRGKLELYGTQADEANEGTDSKVPIYHRQIANPQSQDPNA